MIGSLQSTPQETHWDGWSLLLLLTSPLWEVVLTRNFPHFKNNCKLNKTSNYSSFLLCREVRTFSYYGTQMSSYSFSFRYVILFGLCRRGKVWILAYTLHVCLFATDWVGRRFVASAQPCGRNTAVECEHSVSSVFQQKVAKSMGFCEKPSKLVDWAKTSNFSCKLPCLRVFSKKFSAL